MSLEDKELMQLNRSQLSTNKSKVFKMSSISAKGPLNSTSRIRSERSLKLPMLRLKSKENNSEVGFKTALMNRLMDTKIRPQSGKNSP